MNDEQIKLLTINQEIIIAKLDRLQLQLEQMEANQVKRLGQ